MSTPMTDAKVYKVGQVDRVDWPTFDSNMVTVNTSTLHSFGKKMNLGHIPYHEMGEEILMRDYNEFFDGLVKHCKLLFVTDPNLSHNYDAFTHSDTIGWSVRVGGPEIDFFKELFKCELTHYNDLEVRWMETKVPVEPTTLRECFKQAWRIIRKRFSRER